MNSAFLKSDLHNDVTGCVIFILKKLNISKSKAVTKIPSKKLYFDFD